MEEINIEEIYMEEINTELMRYLKKHAMERIIDNTKDRIIDKLYDEQLNIDGIINQEFKKYKDLYTGHTVEITEYGNIFIDGEYEDDVTFGFLDKIEEILSSQ